ncbi:hypothetical protein QFC22_002672 [Naganishia vaughanmartiniae]|uniref:Uncharacterized protein n=1 Tax=Naganishia vaughanmartiniae TaxID=1424756 RepID=A0ACC2XAS5_9TREE|nr:hypothetical protein QFC22_002672 [Naganishia vaughanmartiniae]
MDDETLRAMFDNPADASRAFGVARSEDLTPTGLFLHPRLQTPEYMQTLTAQTLQHGIHLVDRICSVLPPDQFQPIHPEESPFAEYLDRPRSAYEHAKALRMVPKLLDRLSDVLCLVIDMAELVRNVHPDDRWIAESDRAYERLGSFMNGLNTHQGLYQALKLCRDSPHDPPLTTAEHQLIRTFMTDFEKSGIHLPPDRRHRFVELSDEIQLLGRRFLHDVAQAAAPAEADGDADSPSGRGAGMLAGLTGSAGGKSMIEIPDADALLVGMGKPFIDALPRGSRLGGASRLSRFVSPNSWAAQMIIRHAPNERARRIVYQGCNRYSQERVDVLESLLEKRGELAGVLDQESWAASVLSDKMAKTPENVMGFLTSLAQHHLPKARTDVGLLAALKRRETSTDRETSTINAWDRDYFTERYMAAIAPGSRVHPIHPFFSAGTVIQGLSRLFTNLYGIRFVPCALRSGEAWDKDVRKVQVVDETEGVIGSIYFDLFSRPGKSPNAAHYTVRCSRRIDDDDLPGDRLPAEWDWQAGMTGVENYEGVCVKGRPGRYQLPLVVLTTDFARPSFEEGPSLLAWQEVETLFHEMGHAIHSMLGRTEYHNVSGTRCATDFVELPSILMESFVSSPAVLPLFARHFVTDTPLPLEHFQSHLALQSSLSALELNSQITMAMLDQMYHSPLARDPRGIDTTSIYHNLMSKMGVIPPVQGTAWQTQFGHLVGYGATYYSYTFDRAIAGKVWSTLFANDPLSREGGEKLRQDLLGWGGGKDPWEMVADVVGNQGIASGDAKAMQTVGSWLQ